MKVIASAMQGAQKILDRTLQGIMDEDAATDDDMLSVYGKLRGNPRAIAMYAVKFAPNGSNPMVEAHKYEQAMEDKWKAKYGNGGMSNG